MVGHETTAGSLAFTLLELARKPEIQQRLRDEIRAVGRDLSYDDIQRLQFLDAVVKEGYGSALIEYVTLHAHDRCLSTLLPLQPPPPPRIPAD